MPKPSIDHIGVIVPDIEKALALLENLFGVTPGPIKDKESMGLRLAMVEFENVGLELIQYTDEESSFKPILGGREGMNHVSVQVPDMDVAIKTMAANQVQPADGSPFQGSKGPLAFNRAETALGMLFELYQVADK
jgi:methylmalonyl-CoA/ethylmalonyl-CoA epimerase